MIFIAGVSPRLKQMGQANGGCPACNVSGQLYIVKQYRCVTFFFIPVIPFGGEYIATCGSCASMMALRKDAGKQMERNPDHPIGPYDLEIVSNNHGPRCPRCGRRIGAGYSFCPGCGVKL